MFLAGSLGTLPSEEAARRLVKGEPGALSAVLGATLIRAAIISLPFFLLKIEPRKVLLGSAASSALITSFVIWRVSVSPEVEKP